MSSSVDPISGLRTRLFAVDPPDAAAILEMLSRQQGNDGRYRSLGALSPASAIDATSRADVLAQFAICRADDPTNTAMGLAQVFLANLHHGTAQFGFIVDERWHSAGWPLEGAILAMVAAFELFPLRKLYLEMASEGDRGFGSSLPRLLDHEAHFAAHEWREGTYVDVDVYAAHRDTVLAHPLTEAVLARR